LSKRWKLKIVGALNVWNSIGDVRLMITHNFRLGFSTSYFVSISYDSSSQGGYSSLM